MRLYQPLLEPQLSGMALCNKCKLHMYLKVPCLWVSLGQIISVLGVINYVFRVTKYINGSFQSHVPMTLWNEILCKLKKRKSFSGTKCCHLLLLSFIWSEIWWECQTFSPCLDSLGCRWAQLMQPHMFRILSSIGVWWLERSLLL